MGAYLNALLIAERIVCDDLSRRFTLVNIADAYVVSHFPARLGQFGAYASVTDIQGTVVGAFQILDPDMNVIASVSAEPIIVERSMVQEFRGVFGNVIFQRAGRHSVQFLINGEVIGVTRLDVNLPIQEFHED